MSEYDLQFQADLEKAQALSLESLALEQFRRKKQLTTDNVRDASASARRREESEAPPPALPPPPRRPSRGRTSTTEAPKSTSTSPNRSDSSDLISFASPTSKTAPKDPHASLKEYIEQFNNVTQQTQELALTTNQPAMNNHYYNQRPGLPYPYNYNYQPPYQPPYPPASPYGMPSPGMPTPGIPSPGMPNYAYYPAETPPYTSPPNPMYPTIPYNQTRMASPSPSYVGYPPSNPLYNYNTTNMISRPTRPVTPSVVPSVTPSVVPSVTPSIYPQLSQVHGYPPMVTGANNNGNVSVAKNEVKETVDSSKTRKTSEVSTGSNESNDTLGSLPKSMNLIDFGGRRAGAGSVRVSVLEAFDPLLTEPSSPEYAVASEGSGSVYEEYDPLDFLYGETEMRETPVYGKIDRRKESAILPSPPPKNIPSVPAVAKRTTTNKLYDCIVKCRTRNSDSEHRAFLKMVLDVRKRFVHSDHVTNPGHVVAARSGGKYPPNTSIKILVHHNHSEEPITFTSDVESTVEHVILTVICSLDEDIRDDMSEYMLRVWGAKEYLTPGSSLSEYDYIRECVRLEKDVRLCLHEGKDRDLARTERDDARDAHLTMDDLIPTQGAAPMLSFDNLSILLETLEGELSRAVGVVGAEGTCSPKAVFQAVKAICALAGQVETLHVTHTLNAFAQAATQGTSNTNLITPEIQADTGQYCSVSIRSATPREAVQHQCNRVRDAVRSLIGLYTRTRLLDFQLADPQLTPQGFSEKATPASKMTETMLFCIEAVHRLPPGWAHEDYVFHAQVHYGTRPLKTLHMTQTSKIDAAGFYQRIIFDTWLNLEDLPISQLPREARLVLTLYGRTPRPVDGHNDNDADGQNNADSGDVQYDMVELGWASMQLFDFDGMLCAGAYALALWPGCCDRRMGPAPHPADAPPGAAPVLNIGKYALALWPGCCDRRMGPAPHPADAPPGAAPVLNIGKYALALWPGCCDRRMGPAPHPADAPPGAAPVLNIGKYALALWPGCCDRRMGPAPHPADAPPGAAPVLNIGKYALALWPGCCDRRMGPAPHPADAPPGAAPVLNIGKYALALWPGCCDRRMGPAPHPADAPPGAAPVLNIGKYALALWPGCCDRRMGPAPHPADAPPGAAPVLNIGKYALALWPGCCDRRMGPAPHPADAPPGAAPVLNIGKYALALWPGCCDRRMGPAPHPADAPPGAAPVLNIGKYALALWPGCCDRRMGPAPHPADAPPGAAPVLNIGKYALALWPGCCDRRMGPAPHPADAPPGAAPVLNIEIPTYIHHGVRWTAGEIEKSITEPLPAFDSLDGHTQSQLLHLIEQGAYQRMPTDCREVMWEKRQYLVELPGALPLVLLAATNWYGEHRAQLINLLRRWEKPSALNAMHLLLPCFPDWEVRETAASLLSQMSDDELCRVLPQLTQALRHETYQASPLAELLLSRALAAPAVAHRLFWLLVHSLPNVPQAPSQEFLGITLEDNSVEPAETVECVTAMWRYRLMLRALLCVCGEQLTRTLVRQQLLVKTLSEVALSVKCAKDGGRARALSAGGERLAALLRAEPAALPLALPRAVHDVDVKSCMYFNSNTLPLKINFIGSDNAVIPAMFKVGDDLRQDALVLQVMKVMDSLWLKANLDLRMVTFQTLPTSDRRGMIEIVAEAETLRAIQTEWGLTGSFKDKPIAEWLAKHNPSELEYQRARDNFTASCAGYSVATYLLGICDRHNDNIMLKTSGHLFHIDFGKFLGDAQMFGNFKRDRAPFVLTNDMVYVINGGDRPTQRFQHFVEQCCMAFNVVRQHHDHILDLFALMAASGVPGVTSTAVGYVRAALMPDATNAEAAAAFARLIHSSLKSKFTPINFFLHNLAQFRASGDTTTSASELLSFMPRTYTMAQEGRLVSVECLGFEKRYDPEKHYVYALRIYRQGQATPSVLYRSYKHFTELYQKICLHFPLAKVHSLPSGLHVGRSNIRQVAERRFGDVQAFLTSLFSLADEIAHSDLVYTFFHPLLRDQQDVEPQRMKNPGESVEASNTGSGSLKLSVQYAGGVLSVLILHAQSLAATAQGVPPNPYVKVYLVPDPTKETKRKTRVLKRNSHPSFMEMLEYRLPIDIVQNRCLQATVWHYDSLQENTFLGGVMIPLNTLPLRQETVAWYPLEYIPR